MLKDGEPVQVTSGGERYRYYLGDNGWLGYEGSGGAAYSGCLVKFFFRELFNHNQAEEASA